nr:ABC transporter ATP-binding protein [PVC group bacterium]
VLSHVTEPSAGRVEIHGRISSLLEVGTGFHPELSGRDNVYLNGTILGMTKNEIDNKFDEIVDFSGVEKFIDTPVKRYSSGMRLRLAFSVAAHLRTEIMLIDEVLAVGDAAFRKKCIERMKFLASEGRTVVLVSHNMSIVSSMCSKGIVLQRGKMHFAGSASAAVGAYERLSAQTSDSTFVNSEGGVVIKSLRLERAADKLTPESQMSFLIDVAIKKPYWTASVVFGLRTLEGEGLVLDVADSSKFPDMIIPGVYTFRVSLPKLWLRPRTYTVRSKIIAHPEVGKAERFESDPVDIVIDGSEVTGLYDWMLQPQVDWEINSLTS